MSNINLYPNDLRMPQARNSIIPGPSYVPSASIHYNFSGIPNRPFVFDYEYKLERYFCSYFGYSNYYLACLHRVGIESSYDIYDYCTMELYFSSLYNMCSYNMCSYNMCSYNMGRYITMVPKIETLDYMNLNPNSISRISTHATTSNYATFNDYNYQGSGLHFSSYIGIDYQNSRYGIKHIEFEIELDSILTQAKNTISYDYIFEKLKPKILEKYNSLFQGDINTYSSTLFNFYSRNEPNYSSLISSPRPNINKQKVFNEASLIDFPYYNYCTYENHNYESKITNFCTLYYSGFIPLRKRSTYFRDYVSTINFNKPYMGMGNPYVEYAYCSIRDSSYSSYAIYELNEDGLNITPNKDGKYIFRMGTIGSQYYPDNTELNSRELDIDIIVSYTSGSDFEPDEKSYNIDIFEKKVVNFKDYYSGKAAALNIISDNPELIVKSLGNGVFEFLANKSGTYTASQYVDGKLKSNKINIVANNILVDKTINANYFSNIKISIDEICPGIPEDINVELEYNSNYLEINKENRILYIKSISNIYSSRNIVYRVNEKDSATITLNLSSANIGNITSSFMIIDKNKNRRIYSVFEDYRKYFSKIVNNEIFMINKIEDILDYQELYKGTITLNNIEDLKLVVENNKFKIKNSNNTIYSSEKANGKSIFIKVNNTIKVLYFDELLYDFYYSKKEYDKLKSYYKSLKFINFDEVFSEILTSDISANNQYDITIFYINNKNKIQMWKFAQYETESIIPSYDSKSFNINGVEDSINKLGCSFYKEDGIFGLYSDRDDLINSVDIELKTGNSNPYNLSEMKNNGNKLIIANSENHKAVYSKILEKNKKYSLTDLKKPSNLKVFAYDKDDNKVGEFGIISNGFGDYKIKDSLFTSKDDIEDVDLSFCIEGNSINSKTYECFETEIKCRMDKTYKLIIYKNFKDANPSINSSNNKINISKIEETDDQIVYEISPIGTSDINGNITISDDRYSNSISVEFKNIVYSYKPTTKSELQTLLFNTSPTPKLEEIDVSEITDMSYLFQSRNGYNFNGIEYWDVSNVTNMYQMFNYCNNFNKNINSWDVSKVADMQYIFYNCTNFNQPLNNWNTSKVTYMSNMFCNCTNFNQPLNNWDVSSVTNMGYMFQNCTNFNQDISNWNVSNVTNMYGMFYYCYNFNQDISKWPIYSTANFSYILYNCYNFDQDMSNFNLLNNTNNSNMSNMFYNTKIENTYKSRSKHFKLREQLIANKGNLQNVDISRYTNLCNLFNDSKFSNWTNEDFNGIDQWDTSNVTNMAYMFYNCTKFNQPLNNWVTSKVTNMYGMFQNCTNFNQSLNNWNVSNVTNMSYMFQNCTNFNQPLNNWDVSSVTNMSYMFYYCRSFNQNISNWNVSKVTDMSYMFYNCTNFNQDISNWDVSNVTNYGGIFSGCGISTNNKPPKFR